VTPARERIYRLPSWHHHRIVGSARLDHRQARPDDPPEAFAELCRDELSGVDVAAGGWDIRARWFGVVICARLGEPDRDITIPWRVIAAQITAQRPRGL
jgi:hypothetical protein